MKAKRSGWAHPVSTSSRENLARRILTARRRRSRFYRLERQRLEEREAEKEMKAA